MSRDGGRPNAILATRARPEVQASSNSKCGCRIRKLEKMHTVVNTSMLDQESLNGIQEELDELEKSVPVVPEDINRAVEERYQDYSFVPNATDLRPGQEDRS